MLFLWPSTNIAFESLLSRSMHSGLTVAQTCTLTNMLSAVKRSCSLYASRLSLQHGPASLYHELCTKKGFTTALGEGKFVKN